MITRFVFLVCLFSFSLNIFAAESFRDAYINSRCDRFAALSDDELKTMKTLFIRALRGEKMDAADFRQHWSELGFDWRLVDRWWIASEKKLSCRGQGVYVFNESSSTPTMLQIPHRFKDLNTGRIASRWVKRLNFTVQAWNTAPRDIKIDEYGQASDFAHRWNNSFVALTQAFAEVYPQGRIVQLHGFANNKRRSAEGRKAKVIISAGQNRSTKAVHTVHNCLDTLLKEAVLLYPDDVNELGATRNVQGKILRSAGHNGFVHIEFNYALRAQLLKNKALRQSVGQCLLKDNMK
jgi:hypothetical protein